MQGHVRWLLAAALGTLGGCPGDSHREYHVIRPMVLIGGGLPDKGARKAANAYTRWVVREVSDMPDDYSPAEEFDSESYVAVEGSGIPGGGLGWDQGIAPVSGAVVLFAGGIDPGTGKASRKAYLYDGGSDTWTTLPEMNAARQGHTAAALAEGRVLLAGGTDGSGALLKSSEVFDPGTRRFVVGPEMAAARVLHRAVTLQDGRVLILGGDNKTGRAFEIYDPKADAFVSAGQMVSDASTATLLLDGRVLVAGGFDTAFVQIFDPARGTFTRIADMPNAHSMGARASRLADGRVLVTGGWSQMRRASAYAHLYDPRTDAWTAVCPMGSARALHGQVTLHDGRVLVCGGLDDDGDILASAEIFDPASRTFTTLRSAMAFGRYRLGAVALAR